ncbi:hypothetical protein Bbelb_065620 [Branchiostoma belcheri]|nr:hypothetical protein Bbelb_065620 [Branchiostoma belcheri]
MAASSTVEGEFRPLIESVCKDFGRPWPLKPLQEKAVTYFVQRRKDIFACLPTGYGKTELYTLVPLVMERLLGKHCVMLVVSPLLSLMQDQVQRLQQGGIKAAYVGETQEDADIKRGVIEGKYSLVFVSPEAILNSKSWRGMLTNKTYREHLVGVAVDEAHCITSWGGEFRKDYKRLAELRSLLGDVPFMTLTATATEEIRKDILSSLCMDLDTFTVSVPSNRPNIMYHAVPSSHDSRKEFGWLVEELKKCGDSFPWNKHEGLSSVPELSDEELLKVSSYRQPTEEQLHMLKESLIDYRNDLLDEMKPSLYNFDITIGLSLSTIDNIVDSCATLVARDDIITNIGLWDEEVVDMVFTILEESFQ